MAVMPTLSFNCVLAPTTKTRLSSSCATCTNWRSSCSVVVIWDGLPSHRSRRMTEWVASQRDWLSTEALPGYAPDVNPTEQVWGSLKSTELANLCADTISEVAESAEDGLDRISSDAPLCFAFLRHCG